MSPALAFAAFTAAVALVVAARASRSSLMNLPLSSRSFELSWLDSASLSSAAFFSDSAAASASAESSDAAWLVRRCRIILSFSERSAAFSSPTRWSCSPSAARAVAASAAASVASFVDMRAALSLSMSFLFRSRRLSFSCWIFVNFPPPGEANTASSKTIGFPAAAASFLFSLALMGVLARRTESRKGFFEDARIALAFALGLGVGVTPAPRRDLVLGVPLPTGDKAASLLRSRRGESAASMVRALGVYHGASPNVGRAEVSRGCPTRGYVQRRRARAVSRRQRLGPVVP